MSYDYLVVGAGIFGCVVAERIATELGKKVLIIDKRPHIGGNCYSELDKETGIEYHVYGTHIFHCSSPPVWEYINRFTDFNSYRHQVLTTFQNRVYQMPINLETINSFYNLNLRPKEAKELIQNEVQKAGITNPQNLEEKAISLIGQKLYEAFIKGYTIKQWDTDPKELPAQIITRLPVRYSYREDYFVDDRWQGIPLNGYTHIFEKILETPNIHLELDCDYFEQGSDLIKVTEKTIFTGPIDRYFENTFGTLEWRSVNFKKEIIEEEDYQGTSVMNFADIGTPYTRIHEFRHLHPERTYTDKKTVICTETSVTDPEAPYYPVNTDRNKELLQKYRKLSHEEQNVIFGGRLGHYMYYDMDKAILAALQCFEKLAHYNV